MDAKRIESMKSEYDALACIVPEENVEYWMARELMPCLGYLKWENFQVAIKRAMESCETAGVSAGDHFRDVRKKVALGSGAKREIQDYMLTRYACYLVAMNGDPRKDEIAFAQSYFAIRTRQQELIEERIRYIERINAREKLAESETRLSKNIFERGVDDDGFARIRSKGDEALFGGLRTLEMKRKLGVREYRPLADFLPTLTIAAKNLAVEMTNHNVERKDLQGEKAITVEHVDNNETVRKMLGERGIKPEELPPAEDIRKLERRVKREDRQLPAGVGKLPEAKD